MTDQNDAPKRLDAHSAAVAPVRPVEASTVETASAARPSPRLLEFLVCPRTKTTLQLSADGSELISRAARLAYPIRNGIPLLTNDTARVLTDEDLRS